MPVANVVIRNFRGIREASLDMARFHVLVGENGSGKTSVLDAIRLATSTSFPSSSLCEQDFHSSDEGPIEVGITFAAPFAVKIEDGFTEQTLLCEGVDLTIKRRDAASPGKALSDPFVVSQLCRPVEYESVEQLTDVPLPDGVNLGKLPPAVRRVSEGFEVERKGGGKARSVRSGMLHLRLDLIGYPLVFYFDRAREKESQQGFNTLLKRLTRDLNWRYRRKWVPENTDQLWTAYYDDTVGTVQEKKGQQLLNRIRPRLTELLGSEFDDLELSLLNIEEPFANAFLSRRTGLNQVDVDGLGAGVAAVLSYCLLENVSRRAKQEIIFLIDEPELHLHLQVQRRLCEDFKRADHQVIAASHSPAFVCLDNWRGLTRIEAGGSCFPSRASLDCVLEERLVSENLDDIRRYHHHRTIFSDTDADLLFASRVLLVEGPAEKYGLPRLGQLVDLDLNGATIISCNGKTKIAHYVLLCHAYGIKPFVIFDLDGEPPESTQNATLIRRLGNARYFAFRQSFEQAFGIGPDRPHKASTTLIKIDETERAQLPAEIDEALMKLREWYNEPFDRCAARHLYANAT